MIRRASWGVCVLVTMSAACIAVADTITMRSGEKCTGRITAEDAQSVTVEMGQSGIAVTKSIPRSEIASIAKETAPTGPRYFEIPVMGVVGEEITADTLADALAAARSAKATHVVLLIDSHGGMVAETERIIQVMQENKDLQTIAFVRNAHSAAAVIAGTCKTIVMHPMGQMGAAVPFVMDPSGNPRTLPGDVKEKLSSAVRALVRTAASVGGHPSELFMGMIDPDIELYYRDDAGQARVTEDGADGATCIKRRGKILTMTAQEATKYGLAAGTCKTMADVGAQVGVGKWSSAGEDGWNIVRQRASSAQAKSDSQIDARQAEAIRKLGEHAEELLTQEMRKIQNEIDLNQKYLDAMEQQYRSDNGRIAGNSALKREYDRQKQIVLSRLEVWQKRLDACRKQLDYVKSNMQ